MALILSIDTSSSDSTVSLANDDLILATQKSDIQKNHASFVQPAIQQIFSQTGSSLNAIDAVAVVAGPGSYTGLRVGLASAKGICYALDKPLIFLSSLELLALSSIEDYHKTSSNQLPVVYCPMIDARRMEVFTCVYDEELQILEEPHAAIINDSFLAKYLAHYQVIFSGNGAAKFSALNISPNAFFSQATYLEKHLSSLSLKLYNKNRFVDIAYSEPVYLKEFFSLKEKNKNPA